MATEGNHSRQIADLVAWESCQVAPGVTATKYVEEVSYHGTKLALLNSGLFPADWFPEKPMPGPRSGTVRHVVYYEFEGKRVRVHDDSLNADTRRAHSWSVQVPLDRDEIDRLRQAEHRVMLASDKANDLYQALRRLATSSPCPPTAFSEAALNISGLTGPERRHLELLRRLPEDVRDAFFELTSEIFAPADVPDSKNGPRRPLRLV